MSELLCTPLCDRHKALGAKMVPFAGWLMPVSYSGITQEHFAVRRQLGIFDASHMGLVRIAGTGALAFLQKITVNDVARLAVGQSQYSAMCYPNGTCVDDIYVNRTGDQEFHVVINAGCKAKDVDWMRSQATDSMTLELLPTGIIAVQGPLAAQLVPCLFGKPLADLSKNESLPVEYAGERFLVTRTGYTGEDGFELFPLNTFLGEIWDRILAEGKPMGIRPCGLGSRDTLRLESGFSLYGHEINDTTNLVEAGLSWIVGWNKPDFIGREALQQVKAEGPSRKLVGLVAVDKAIPREGMVVVSNEREVGKITSGGMSPVLNQGIALAYVESSLAKMGTEVHLQIRDQLKKFRVSGRRFVGGK
ncbi:MAG TPA: glycine cleavage system aminomethyltransferase GcvT [Fibrobacteraceae bacterium]|nr:glycine cleavage system aminomethyltransferase GcvT [Fibrobacteraceae bacterium]